jgi:hypothetical protein
MARKKTPLGPISGVLVIKGAFQSRKKAACLLLRESRMQEMLITPGAVLSEGQGKEERAPEELRNHQRQLARSGEKCTNSFGAEGKQGVNGLGFVRAGLVMLG